MNPLQTYIAMNRLDPGKVMDRLQGHGGIISDNCVNPEDCDKASASKAVRWLEAHK